MSDEFLQPWINGVEHLDGSIVRFHFVGGVVRDVDLRAVLSEEEFEALDAEPGLMAQVATNVMWPNDVRIDSAMISLIYEGYGARKGWGATAPEQPADSPFPVPPLQPGSERSGRMLSNSSWVSRLDKLGRAFVRLPDRLQAVTSWWDDAQPRLVDHPSASERMAVLRSGRAAMGVLGLHIDEVRKELEFLAGMDAIADGDTELIDLVASASRYNLVWTIQQLVAATTVFDPFTSPEGFRGRAESAERHEPRGRRLATGQSGPSQDPSRRGWSPVSPSTVEAGGQRLRMPAADSPRHPQGGRASGAA